MNQIIIDTNMLMTVAQFKVDIFSEINRICLFNYELCIIDKTMDELKKIYEKQKGKHKAAAKLALALVKSYNVKEINTKNINCENADVDDRILKTAEKGRHIVATQDVMLKRELREKGIPIITLRQKKHLVLE